MAIILGIVGVDGSLRGVAVLIRGKKRLAAEMRVARDLGEKSQKLTERELSNVSLSIRIFS